MASTRQINQAIIEGMSLKAIASAYSEISALKLKKIRGSIEANKRFSYELLDIFGVLKNLALKKGTLSPILKRLVEKNGRSIALVISSNYRFYGELESDLLNFFNKDVLALNPSQVIVIGRTGTNYLKVNHFPLAFDSAIFTTDLPTEEELNTLMQKISNFKKIIIYHSTFKTILTQKPTATDITQSVQPPNQTTKATAVPTASVMPTNPDFILEPELEKIMQFFDSQIITLLIEDIFLEEELSKTAARLISMSSAEGNANKFLSTQKKLLYKAKKSVAQARLISTFSSFVNWRQHGSTV